MKNFYKYFGKYKKSLILGPAFKFIETVTELIIPLLIAAMIDIGVKNSDTKFILTYGGIVIMLNIIGVVVAVISHAYSARASVGIGADIRLDLYKKVNTFSHAELDRFSISTINNRLTHDVSRVQHAISAFVRTVMRTPFLLIGSIILAMSIDIKLSLIFLLVAPLVLGFVTFILKITVPLYDKTQKNLDNVSNITKENIEGIRVVRAFNKQDVEETRFLKGTKDLQNSSINVSAVSAFLNPVTSMLINFAIIGVLWFGGIQVNIGGLSQGQILAFINYLTQISIALVRIANIVVVFIKAINCGKRINEILDTEVSIKNPETVSVLSKEGLLLNTDIVTTDNKDNVNTNLEIVPEQEMLSGLVNINDINNKDIKTLSNKKRNDIAIEFNNVSFAYGNNSKNAIEGLDIKIKRGQTIGIIGGTGSGKSTITYLLARFYDATEGEVLVNNKNVKDYDLKELRSLFGIVPQRAVLFSGTIKDNLKFRKEDATHEEMIKALKTAQAYEFVKELDDKLDHIVQAGGQNFSGGQRQRLTIARAVVGNPEILILDDSASALDFVTDANLRAAIKENTHDMTVIVVSQRVNSIKHSDAIIVLDNGQVIGIGKHNELLKTCEIYKEIHDSQNI